VNRELSLSHADTGYAAKDSGAENVNREITERTSLMGLLPCLRRGSDRWWLPCGAEATEVIGSLLLAAGRQTGIDSATRAQVLRTLKADPPLLIFAALHASGEQLDSGELVDWLADNVTSRFASGDAFLGAPQITAPVCKRWNKLRDHFRTLPVEHWLQDASLWLEVTGPRVSNRWREQWPELTPVDNDSSETDPTDPTDAPTVGMLPQLARMMQRQRSLEETFDRQLLESKLGALKQLAYGLSHEINNPLANISTRAEQLRRGEQDPTRSATLQRIIDQVYRAHEMIADLMFYANPPAAVRSCCDLNPLLGALAESFRGELKRQAIRIEVITPGEPTESVVDANMIQEAARVLIRNAIDAIGCQGTIVVSLVREEGRMMIHVADSGPGLSDEARQHAFDPYFSGREAGRGLGLGLCRAYRIAKLHFGDVTLAGGPTGCVATITLSDYQ
jgi:signal transduction histidine kinase